MKRSDKKVNPNAVRSFRKLVERAVRAGTLGLVCIGERSNGYRLGAERAESIVLFGQTHSTQKAAMATGVDRYGQKAVKVLPKKAA